MALSALGFNCLGTGANYNHLSQQTTAASVYTSVREAAEGGEAAAAAAAEGTTSDTEGRMSSCFGSHWICGRETGEEGDILESKERLGRVTQVLKDYYSLTSVNIKPTQKLI